MHNETHLTILKIKISEKIRLGVNSHAEETVSIIHVSTTISTSNVVPALGSALNSNDSLSKLQAFIPINSMLEWTNKSQKMLSVVVLLHSGMDDKRMSKVTISACNTKLQIKML